MISRNKNTVDFGGKHIAFPSTTSDSKITSSSYSQTILNNSSANQSDDDDLFEDASSDISTFTRQSTTSSMFNYRKVIDDGNAGASFKPQIAEIFNIGLHSQKILEPLYLRRCNLQKAKQGKAPPFIRPMINIDYVYCSEKHHIETIVLPSLDVPTFCVRYLSRRVMHKARQILIYQSKIETIKFFARSVAQYANHREQSSQSEIVKLMMNPGRAQRAQKLIPSWKIVTFTLAFGKHVAVKYRVFDVKKENAQVVKAQKMVAKRVSTATLYRKEPIQKVITWNSARPHSIRLSTVEKNDPQLVKKVFLDINPFDSDFGSIASESVGSLKSDSRSSKSSTRSRHKIHNNKIKKERSRIGNHNHRYKETPLERSKSSNMSINKPKKGKQRKKSPVIIRATPHKSEKNLENFSSKTIFIERSKRK